MTRAMRDESAARASASATAIASACEYNLQPASSNQQPVSSQQPVCQCCCEPGQCSACQRARVSVPRSRSSAAAAQPRGSWVGRSAQRRHLVRHQTLLERVPLGLVDVARDLRPHLVAAAQLAGERLAHRLAVVGELVLVPHAAQPREAARSVARGPWRGGHRLK
jgi:hypothetical protein